MDHSVCCVGNIYRNATEEEEDPVELLKILCGIQTYGVIKKKKGIHLTLKYYMEKYTINIVERSIVNSYH